MRKILALILLLLLALTAIGQSKLSGGTRLSGGVSATVIGGGEVDFVTDSFTEASDTELSLHTPELGSAWVEHPDATYGPSIVNGAADRVYATGNPSAYFNNTAPPSADYCVEAVVRVVSAISANAAIALRMDTTNNSMYIFQLNNGTGWRLRKVIHPSTQTTLGTEDTTTEIPSVGEAKTMTLCVSGTTLTPFVNGTQITSATATDSDLSAAGRAGVRFSGTFSDTAGFHFESFRAYTP